MTTSPATPDEPEFRVIELDPSEPERALGLVTLHAIHYRNLCLVIADHADGWSMTTTTGFGSEPHLALAKARGYLPVQIRRKADNAARLRDRGDRLERDNGTPPYRPGVAGMPGGAARP